MSIFKIFGSSKSKQMALQSDKQPEMRGDATVDEDSNFQNARGVPNRVSISKSGRYKGQMRRRSSLFDNEALNIAEEIRGSDSDLVVSNSQPVYTSGNSAPSGYGHGNGNGHPKTAAVAAARQAADIGNGNAVDNAALKKPMAVK